ncbi:uncharacterized protein [Chelonus insularis]|uniref:uncharacterized protein n=1 Tax=Chelonus insularis TaxID=460826 RepID=UPI00158A37A3|nr:uncharacterized protein LOC118068454 [Chelonus insularis]
MEKLLLMFLFYFITINVGECQTENNYLNRLAFLDGDRFTCIGVLLSPRHALFNGNCVQRRNFTDHGKLGVFARDVYSDTIEKTATNYRNVVAAAYESDCKIKLGSSRIQNCFVVLTLESDFEVGNDIQVTKLPTSPITENTLGFIFGWHNKCTTRSDQRIVVANISVVARNMCADLQADEFCAMDTMTERIHSSSPVISGDTIIGFTTVGCHYSTNTNPVTDLYLHAGFLKSHVSV